MSVIHYLPFPTFLRARPAVPQPKPSTLSRITTSNRFIPEIDGLRFLAILSVFLLHDLGQVMAKNNIGVDSQRHLDLSLLTGLDHALASLVLTCGAFGVQLFFVISGFILGLPFAEHHLLGKPKPSLSAFLLRRVTRLEPPFLLNLLLQAILLGFALHWQLADSLRHFLATATYLHTQLYNQISPINGVTWSLEVEVQFYLLAPFLSSLFALKSTPARRTLLVLLILTLATLNNLLAPQTFRYQGSLLFAIQYFLAGFLLADLYLLNPTFLQKKHLLWDALALLLAIIMLASLLIGGGPWGSLTFHLPFCILLFYIAGFKSILFRRFLTTPAIYLVGGMCYTLYLYHGIFITAFAPLTRILYLHNLPLYLNYPLQFALHATLVLLPCILLFRLVERPCMNRHWPQLLWQKIFTPVPKTLPAPHP